MDNKMPKTENSIEKNQNDQTGSRKTYIQWTKRSVYRSFKTRSETLPPPFLYSVIFIIYVIFILIYYYFVLPPLTARSPAGWFFLFIICLPPVYFISHLLTKKGVLKWHFRKYSPRLVITSIFTLIFSCIWLVGGLVGSRMFNAKSYSNLMQVEYSDKVEFDNIFDYDYGEVKLPVIDKVIAYRLAQTKLGNYGDQYQIKDDHFSIQSVKRGEEYTLVRVAPLEYANLFVSLGDMNKGTPGYIEVDCLTQEAVFRPVDGGIKYLDSGKFSRDLSRYLRFNNITDLMDEKYFEIDDQGNPYWIVPCHKNKIGLYGGHDPSSVIVLNAVTGEIKNYPIGAEPDWIDHTISREVMMSQANDFLKYKKGFINATIGSKSDVFSLSDGYNYFIKNNNSYFVSTVTSLNENDQTSIGFLAINLKTKHTSFYNLDELQGLTEMRARAIAMQEDSVKAQKFEATWPILISYKGVPTYFLTLKNDVTVQKYCFIDVKTGSKVAIEDSIEKARLTYLKSIQKEPDAVLSSAGTIFRTAIIEDSLYFIINEDQNKIFKAELDLNPLLKLLEKNDRVDFIYQTVDGENIVTAITITFDS